MSPIKGLTEKRRMPRIGKIHLGIKVTNKKGTEYPKATDYFVYPEPDALGGELLDQLTKAFGDKPKELRIIFPLEDEESIASQYYRCYTRSRGLVCRGDGETCMRMLDIETGALPTKDTKETALKEMDCKGRECPDYDAGQCREVMNLQFMLPEISGMGVWQIDTSSINSIRNINSCLDMIKAIYNRVAMVPLLLTLEKMEVTPPGGTKKSVFVMNIRSTDNVIQAAIKAQKPPLELIAGPVDVDQAEADIATYWPQAEQDRMLGNEEAAGRMTQKEIAKAAKGDETKAEIVLICVGGCGKTTEGMSMEELVAGKFKQVNKSRVPEWTCQECLAKKQKAPEKVVAPTEPINRPEGDEKIGAPADKVKPGQEKGQQQGKTILSSQKGKQPQKIGAPAEPEGFGIDLTWLEESLKTIKWNEDTAKSWLTNHFKLKEAKGPLIEIISNLTHQQAEEFVNEINSRLEKQMQLFS